MSAPFLICALPRSRTAWLANFLTHGEVECGHELASALSQPGLARHLTTSAASYSGNADTLQAIFYDEFTRLVPLAPVVVVKREPAEVAESLNRMGLPANIHMLTPLVDALNAIAKLPGALTIRYSDLSAESAARAILAHVAPSEPFNRFRWQMLQGFNVQITPERLRGIFNNIERNY